MLATPLFTKQEQEGRTKYISLITESMSDDDVEVLAVLYRTCRADGKTIAKGISVKALAEATKRPKIFFWNTLPKLVFAHFAVRQKVRREQCYSITQEGIDALNHLLDEKSFPRQAMKINTILDARR